MYTEKSGNVARKKAGENDFNRAGVERNICSLQAYITEIFMLLGRL